MPSWLIIVLVGVVAAAFFGYLLMKGHLNAKRARMTFEAFQQGLKGYMDEKRRLKEKADKEKAALPKPKPYSPKAVLDFLKRTKKPWPPKK